MNERYSIPTAKVAIFLISLIFFIFFIFANNNNFILYTFPFLSVILFAIILKHEYLNPIFILGVAMVISGILPYLNNTATTIYVNTSIAIICLVGSYAIFKKRQKLYSILLFSVFLVPVVIYSMEIKIYFALDQNLVVLGYYISIWCIIYLVAYGFLGDKVEKVRATANKKQKMLAIICIISIILALIMPIWPVVSFYKSEIFHSSTPVQNYTYSVELTNSTAIRYTNAFSALYSLVKSGA